MTAKVSKKNSFSTLSYQVLWLGSGIRLPRTIPLGPKKDKKVQGQLASLFAAHPKLYWIGIGKTDFLYQQNADLRKFLDEKGYKYTYMETEGGHIWRNWRVYLTTFAQKIFK